MRIEFFKKLQYFFKKRQEPPRAKGLRALIDKLYASFGFSCSGLKAVFISDQSFRLEVFFGFILLPLSFWLNRDFCERSLLIGSYALVLIVELLNTALEDVVDWISPEKHPIAKKIKDTGSAAVFISILVLILTWGQFLYLTVYL